MLGNWEARLEEAEKGAARLSTDPRWYAVHTGPRCESKAAVNLKRAGYWTWAPFTRQTIRVGKRRLRREVERPWFSRYIFVEACEDQIGAVNDTDGVSRVVCRPFSEKALEVPGTVMDRLMELADGELIIMEKPPHWFRGKVGDKVILDPDDVRSAFHGELARIASLARLDSHDELSIWINMLGGEVEMTLPVSRVAVARQRAA